MANNDMGNGYKLVISNPPTLEHCLPSSKSKLKTKANPIGTYKEKHVNYQKEAKPTCSKAK